MTRAFSITPLTARTALSGLMRMIGISVRTLWPAQLAVIVRTVAAIDSAPIWLMFVTALIWTAVMTIWSLRFGNWYGRPRSDGKPG